MAGEDGEASNRQCRYGVYLGDLRRTSNRSHGIVNYAVGLVNALPAHLNPEESLSVLVSDEVRNELYPDGCPDRVSLVCCSAPTNPLSRLMRDHLAAVRWATSAGLSLIHFPKGFLPFRALPCPSVVTLHDDIPLQYPANGADLAGRLRDRYFRWALGHALSHADGVITVSPYSRARLSGYVPRDIEVIPNGISVPRRPVRPLDERDPFIIHLGSPLAHKRSARAVAWTLRALDEHQSLHLIVTGTLDARLEADLAGNRRVRRVTNVLTQAELGDLISRARGLVFSSETEGFGLPPIEAFAAGTPAVWSRHTASEDTMQGLPCGFAVDDYAEFTAALREALSLDEAELVRLSELTRSRYSWDRVAEQTLDYYRKVRSSTGGHRSRRRSVCKLPP